MFADEAAGSRERVVLSYKSNSICITFFLYKGEISRYINMGRAEGNTRNRLLCLAVTAAVSDMFLKIITAGGYSLVYHICGFIADSTVSRFRYGFCGLLYERDDVHSCISVQHCCHHMLQMKQSYTTGNTFATSLCMAHFNKSPGDVYRAESRRACLYSLV